QKNFRGQNAPAGTAVAYYLKAPATDAKLSIVDGMGRTVCTQDVPKDAGIHKVQWTLAQPLLGGGGGAAFGGGGGGGRGGQNGPPEESCSAGGGGRGGGGGFGGGGAASAGPGWYTAKLVVNGNSYSK